MAIFERNQLQVENISDLMTSAANSADNGDFPAALKSYHSILDKLPPGDPLYFDIYKNMGNIYLKCSDIDAAEEKYNLANAIDSNDESLQINYGVLEIQKSKYTDAKSRFSKVLENNSESDLAWVGVALVHRAHADHDLARACLMRGLDSNPYNKMAITNLVKWCEEDGIDSYPDYISSFLSQFPDDQEIQKLATAVRQ